MVLSGNGDGSFRAPIIYPLDYTGVVAIGDFNGDGRDDLAVAYGDGVNNGVYVLLTASDGTFQPGTFYRPGNFVSSLVAGDFNGDGKPDLAGGSEMGNTVSVLSGNGDGTFGASISYPGGVNPRSVVAGDFNRDGRTDIAIADLAGDGSASVTILQGVSATMIPVSPAQSAPLGGPFASALQVSVKDLGGNPVSGVTVTFWSPVTGAGAALSSATAVTKIVPATKGRRPNLGPPSARGSHLDEKISPMDTPSFTNSWIPCQAMKVNSRTTIAIIDAAATKTTRLGRSTRSARLGLALSPPNRWALVS